MNLTADLTEADILAPVEKARDYLATIAQDTSATADALLDAVHAVYAAEAVANARYLIVTALSTTTDPAQRAATVNAVVLSVLTGPTGDKCSGRGNDARRVANDAVREVMRATVAQVGREAREAKRQARA